MTFKNPQSLLDVLLPSQSKNLERIKFRLAQIGEEVSVNHRVQQPLPILIRHVRYEPIIMTRLVGRASSSGTRRNTRRSICSESVLCERDQSASGNRRKEDRSTARTLSQHESVSKSLDQG